MNIRPSSASVVSIIGKSTSICMNLSFVTLNDICRLVRSHNFHQARTISGTCSVEDAAKFLRMSAKGTVGVAGVEGDGVIEESDMALTRVLISTIEV